MKKLLKFLLQRVVLVALAILIQIAVLTVVIWKLNSYFVYFYAACMIIGLIMVVFIINDKSNPGYKIAWIVPILFVPIFGVIFYITFGGNRMSKRAAKKQNAIIERLKSECPPHKAEFDKLKAENPVAAGQSQYITNYAYSPLYQNTYTQYLPLGEIKFAKMVEELKKAEKFIFLEYFIIEQGKMWNTILDILVEKAKQGVDVRVVYDDMGCIMTLPYGYNKKLESYGIKCRVFNPFMPVMSPRFNNRDHRKIAVIDGHTGFTGGINLADEYINACEKHGHWKDSAIMLKGEAVSSLTDMFLSIWDFLDKTSEDFDKYKFTDINISEEYKPCGYVQPYTDSPMDGEPVGETVYMNLINNAVDYVYITTPYLIIDSEMVTALDMAAKRGVDVRIITPHVPDKWYVHSVTRAYYETLLECGVKIYEYTLALYTAKPLWLMTATLP